MDLRNATPGLDLDRLRPWFAGAVPQARVDALSATLITGGKSNLTYRITDGAASWVLRRPPLGHVLATAHDMGREHAVMSALADTAVPVPRMLGFCRDAQVLGAEFYVMEAVPGMPYRTAAELAPLGERRVRAISTALVDTLADLHEVDPGAVGLGDFGRPEGFLARQVARWRKQLDASRTRDLPAADALHAALEVRAPAADSAACPGIVHGDFRLDNVLIDGDDRLRAVLDWEMATLGDPLTDLALMVLYARLAGIVGAGVADASNAPGFLSEDEFVARYDARSGRDLSDLGFYLGLAAFKLAAILEGIHCRHTSGQTVGPGFDRIGEVVHPLLDAGLAALEER
ncbi:Predicted kinase, aminoglycoside phosphotransferase (APT) family [Saccharopolyspora antimicrobica]|uniref:Aminoglycoside phosphotransferase (APT) family kinase protein n=1 Tax=Saccharopolyspora antimicrobica TaxID=455193 RepID=A0A1I4VLL8_9PSEU|nr:phosphotransferase family protein [Saccharopolyspora antimicrobica]RKT87316.1 aminoglycoside phosphotransferase (APT) family kinase protein [Saccharopolyspora antimicrobica]SFN02023.1 Predicted kinase, aminoglycoside phosphotransferase (APT) family [Saccharopolyspora antimicrobica]